MEDDTVYGPDGEVIGKIEYVLIEQVSGQVGYAVARFRGFEGLAESRHTVPWSIFVYDSELEGYRTELTEEALKEAPRITEDALADPEIETRIHRHYDAPTYWGSITAHKRSGPA